MRKSFSKITLPKHLAFRADKIAFIFLLLLSLPIVLRAQVKIMPLGNSITQGNTQHNSYRRALWFKLVNGGYSVDFVGSQNGNNGGPPPKPDFDLNSEGHWGWRADELLGSIGNWAATYRPDIVLMHVGTNDMLQGQSVESTINEISQIIDKLRAANPNVKILMGKLIPTTQAANNNINALNNALPGLANQKNTSQSSVTIVDQNSGFNASADTFDGVHPTDAGEEKMATKWYQALQPLLASGAQNQTQTSTGPLRAPENPANTTAGLDYQYYEGNWNQLPDFNGLAAAKTGTTDVPTLALRNREENFAFRYTGYLNVPNDGEYTFYTSSDDGSQLLIGSTLVVDNNGLHPTQERSGKISLQKGKHAFKVTFFESTADQTLTVSYEGPGIGKTQIPASAFYRQNTATSAPTPTSTSTTAGFYRGINVNGPALVIDGNSWEGSSAANFSSTGNTYENQSVPLVPATDDVRARMIRSFIWSGSNTLTLGGVPSGTYDVYLYVWEDNNPETFNIRLENNTVVSNYRSGSAGSWQKLGPWRTNITDGAINLATQGGAANVSGLEVWRVATASAAKAATQSVSSEVGTSEAKLQLYPNPSASQVYLNTDEWSQLVVRDNYGRVRLTQRHSQANMPLDTSTLPNGIYSVEVRSTAGSTQRSTLVIEH